MSIRRPREPFHVVVMGVSGSGKSTVARALAVEAGAVFAEGDDFHPPGNRARMRAGVPLSDRERDPWIAALAAWTADTRAEGSPTVLTCSALRRRHRDTLRDAVPEGATLFVLLDAPGEVVRRRMREREHFMPVALLDSQLATLEPLERDEPAATVAADAPLSVVVARALDAVRTRFPHR